MSGSFENTGFIAPLVMSLLKSTSSSMLKKNSAFSPLTKSGIVVVVVDVLVAVVVVVSVRVLVVVTVCVCVSVLVDVRVVVRVDVCVAVLVDVRVVVRVVVVRVVVVRVIVVVVVVCPFQATPHGAPAMPSSTTVSQAPSPRINFISKTSNLSHSASIASPEPLTPFTCRIRSPGCTRASASAPRFQAPKRPPVTFLMSNAESNMPQSAPKDAPSVLSSLTS
mmetsp:Transcript_88556/g.222982  ORF Transcript_88556/g.222982 Transcript_88556/m.222982 type:complete len:222 (-) Transcript_88556:712-1377(-)